MRYRRKWGGGLDDELDEGHTGRQKRYNRDKGEGDDLVDSN